MRDCSRTSAFEQKQAIYSGSGLAANLKQKGSEVSPRLEHAQISTTNRTLHMLTQPDKVAAERCTKNFGNNIDKKAGLV
jgi:hypothetical protein